MKKFRFCIPFLLLALLTACGSPAPTATRFEGESVLATLSQEGVFSEDLEVVDDAIAFSLLQLDGFGLSQEDISDIAMICSTGATCEMAAVLVLSDENQVETAQKALEYYLTAQIQTNESYRPTEIPKLESAHLEQRENTLLLVVGNDYDGIAELLEN